MLSLSDFEKLVSIDRDQEIVKKRNQILPRIDKTERKKFFTTYRYRNLHIIISSYLSDREKINFLYLNRFTLKNLKPIFNESHYKKLKDILMKFYESGLNYYDIIGRNGLFTQNIEKLFREREDFLIMINLLGKWVNSLYLERKLKNSKFQSKISFLSSEDIFFSQFKNLFFLFTVAHNSTLEAIDFSNSSLNEESLKFFKFAFKKEKPIHSLNLENNQITGNKAMEYFTSSFEHFKFLKYLNVSNISMNHKDAEFLSNYLDKLYNIEVIIFDNNCLTSLGAKYLLYSLSKLKNLKKLSLRNCEIEKKFAGPLGSFLKSKEIESVDLSENKHLTYGFVKKFSFFLPDIKLRNLDLDKCNLNEDDMIYILNGIESNENILFLNLNRNDRSPFIMKKISDMVGHHKFERKIYYDGKRYSSRKEKKKFK